MQEEAKPLSTCFSRIMLLQAYDIINPRIICNEDTLTQGIMM
jgi:hypothetical protein